MTNSFEGIRISVYRLKVKQAIKIDVIVLTS